MTALVLAEHDNETLGDSTLATVTAAKTFGEVHILVAGSGAQAVAEAAAKVDGVSKVLHADATHLAHPTAEGLAPIVIALAESYDALLAPASTFGKNVMPRVAAALDSAQVSDISEVVDERTFKRPIYAGNALATVECDEPKKVITVRATSFDKTPAEGGSAEIEAVEAGEDSGLASFVEHQLSDSGRPDLTTADVVVSGGRGVGSTENFEIIERLADKLGGAVGASRAAVDAGFVPNDYQVGQTGKIVAPQLYIAIGISGAIQHLAGMKDSKTIVAINKDEEAPIFQIADYGLVADLFEAVPALEKAVDDA